MHAASATSTACIVKFHDVRANGWAEYLLSSYDCDVVSPRDLMDFDELKNHFYVFFVWQNAHADGLEELIARVRRAGHQYGTFLIGDEWGRHLSPLYRTSDFLIRHHYCSYLNYPSLLNVPLGPPHWNGHNTAPITPASERDLSWFFAGEKKATRGVMARQMRGLGPFYAPTEPIPKEDFDAAMSRAVFAPCPMGNVSIETWRFYEALEYGAIPIVEKRWTIDYYTEVLGAHPIPSFQSWGQAKCWAVRMLASSALDRLQDDIVGWWTELKLSLPEKVKQFITERLAARSAGAPDTGYQSSALAHSVRWKLFCLRMATPASLWSRYSPRSILGKWSKRRPLTRNQPG